MGLKCSQCGAELKGNEKFCGNCGTPYKSVKKIQCNICGADVEEHSKFCGNCGALVKNEVSAVGNTIIANDVAKNAMSQKREKKYKWYILFILLAVLILVIAIWFGCMVSKNDNAITNINTTVHTPVPSIIPSSQTPSSNKVKSEYLFNSDTEYITDDYLNTKTQEEIRLILNEMYARHGYIFTTDKYKRYFSDKSWYIPIYSSDVEAEKHFNDIERQNKIIITDFEKSKGWR